MKHETKASNFAMDFRAYEHAPGVSVIVAPDSPVFTLMATSNDFVAVTGLKRDNLIGKSCFDVLHKDDVAAGSSPGNVLKASFDHVILHKKPHEMPVQRYEMAIAGTTVQKRYRKITNIPILDDDGDIRYILHSVLDVTDQVLANDKAESIKGIEKAYRFFMSAPVIIGYLHRNDYIIELANEGLLRVWKKNSDIIGQSLFKVFPELEAQGIRSLLDDVLKTGKSFYAHSYPITFDRDGVTETLYFDFVYQPFYENDNGPAAGIISIGYDVTVQVIASKKIEESEQKWRQLADTMPAIVWKGNALGSIDFLNQRWYEYTGLTEQESVGTGWTRSVHGDDLERCMSVWNKAVADQAFYETELRYRGRDGQYRWMIARGVPIKENEKVVAWYGTSTDIHERKVLELSLEEKIFERTKELKAKNDLLDSILEHSSNGISVSSIVFDDSGHVVDALTILANEAAVRFSGLPKDLYLTKPATYFDPNIISSPYGQSCISTLQTGKSFIMQYFLEYSSRWLELTVSKMDDSHLIHIFTDVTDIKEAQLKLERSLEELRYSNANLEEFAYAASHDLKEPVRKIQFFSNRLRNELTDKLDANQADMFGRLEKSSKRMDSLINDLLEYSQAAKGSSEKEEIDLNEKMKNVLEDLELEVQRRKANVTVEKLPVIIGNRRQIQQLFQNLIGNALKYSRPDVTPEIRIKSVPVRGRDTKLSLPKELLDASFHLISVSDNGIGFEQGDADRIFKVFTRLHNHPEFRGSGIGLSIVRKVVEGHSGFIWAESQPGTGSTFNILFPAHG